VTSLGDDEPDDEPEPLELETNGSYIKMLQSLEKFAIFRQNEPEFALLGEVIHQVKAKLQLEQAGTMKDQTLDSFFRSAKASQANSIEVTDISDSDHHSNTDLDNIMSLD
jgi:hypothetical protein